MPVNGPRARPDQPRTRPGSARSRRRWLQGLLAAGACLLPACGWDGHVCLLGYTTRPNYDLGIRTVRVPIFKNYTLWRGLEFDLTRAVIREIEAKDATEACAELAPPLRRPARMA